MKKFFIVFLLVGIGFLIKPGQVLAYCGESAFGDTYCGTRPDPRCCTSTGGCIYNGCGTSVPQWTYIQVDYCEFCIGEGGKEGDKGTFYGWRWKCDQCDVQDRCYGSTDCGACGYDAQGRILPGRCFLDSPHCRSGGHYKQCCEIDAYGNLTGRTSFCRNGVCPGAYKTAPGVTTCVAGTTPTPTPTLAPGVTPSPPPEEECQYWCANPDQCIWPCEVVPGKCGVEGDVCCKCPTPDGDENGCGDIHDYPVWMTYLKIIRDPPGIEPPPWWWNFGGNWTDTSSTITVSRGDEVFLGREIESDAEGQAWGPLPYVDFKWKQPGYYSLSEGFEFVQSAGQFKNNDPEDEDKERFEGDGVLCRDPAKAPPEDDRIMLGEYKNGLWTCHLEVGHPWPGAQRRIEIRIKVKENAPYGTYIARTYSISHNCVEPGCCLCPQYDETNRCSYRGGLCKLEDINISCKGITLNEGTGTQEPERNAANDWGRRQSQGWCPLCTYDSGATQRFDFFSDPIYITVAPTGKIQGSVYDDSSASCAPLVHSDPGKVFCKGDGWPVYVEAKMSGNQYTCVDASGNENLPYNLPGGTTYLVESRPAEGWSLSSCPTNINPASVTLNADLVTQDFYLWQRYDAWFQTQGGDVHTQGKISSLLPKTADERFFSLGLDGYPGVVSYGTSFDFRAGSLNGRNWVSEKGWLAKSLFPQTYDYAYFYKKLGSPTTSFNCGSTTAPASGFYLANNSPCEINSSLNFGTKKVVIFVNGHLQLGSAIKNIKVSPGGFLAFIVKGDIKISGQLGSKTTGPFTGTNAHLQGVYLADGVIDTYEPDPSEVGLGSGFRLVAAGIFYARGGFRLQRDLKNDQIPPATVNNSLYPAELFIFRPDLVINSPRELWPSTMSWQEVAP